MSETITCPRCGATSANPTDIAEGYCGHCHDWTAVRAGQRWQFEHGGVDFDIVVTELALDGDIVHGKLVSTGLPAISSVGDLVIVPTRSVAAGTLVKKEGEHGTSLADD